jgi:predicted nucleic acid-binding protein
MKRIIISNTGPVLHLSEAQLLELLNLAGGAYIPERVAIEIAYHLPTWRTPAWLHPTALVDSYAMQATAWQQTGLLDAGEAEAIALAQQLEADWFLTDDAAARFMAGQLGIEVHGSLGIVLWAAATEHLNYFEAKIALQQLARSSLWISARVYTEAMATLAQLFSGDSESV